MRFQLGAKTGDVFFDAVHVCPTGMTFADEFNGTAVDPNIWQHCKAFTGDCAETLIGGLQSWYKPANATVSGGTLKMAVTRETGTVCMGCKFGPGTQLTRDYASVYLQNNAAFNTQYGYLEARMKMPKAAGLWPAFWALPAVSATGQAHWPPEIDILEYYTNQPDISWHTLHYNTATQTNVADNQHYQFPAGSLSNAFHTYAINWTPNIVIWYVDGMEVARSPVFLAREPMQLILNVEVGGLAGARDPALPSAVTEVDYVRVFDNASAFGFAGNSASLYFRNQ